VRIRQNRMSGVAALMSRNDPKRTSSEVSALAWLLGNYPACRRDAISGSTSLSPPSRTVANVASIFMQGGAADPERIEELGPQVQR
jgi:hypothetical protein